MYGVKLSIVTCTCTHEQVLKVEICLCPYEECGGPNGCGRNLNGYTKCVKPRNKGRAKW